MRILIGLLALMLVFGCVDGGEEPPTVNETANVSDGDGGPVTIIVEEQQNQTTEEEALPPPPPVEENVTEEEPSDEPGYSYEPDLPMGVYFIDVAGPALHGNSVLVKKGDLDVLFDAGPKENSKVVIDFLTSRGVDDIEVLVSTNADPRHYGGLEDVAREYEIEQFWWSGSDFRDWEYIGVVDRMKDAAKDTKIVQSGFTADLNGIQFEVISPLKDRFDDVNNDAIVTRVTEGNITVLLTSGIQKGAQQKLVNEQPSKIEADVIQAPYFGVGEGTRDIGLFLLTAEPEYMVVTGSSDDSPANGGSREPYQRLMEQYGIGWNATYAIGTIRVTTDGEDFAAQNVTSSD